MSTTMKPNDIFLLVLMIILFLPFKIGFSIGSDTLKVGQTLSVNQTLVSQSSIFELGYFMPSPSMKMYLGIWYKNIDDGSIVWVANRDSPIYNPEFTLLQVSADGNLVLRNTTTPIWSTALTSLRMANFTEAVLLDSGNLVIRDGSNPSSIYWQSFDYLTDTLLPGAKLGFDKRTGVQKQLVSWRNAEDPTPGMYSVGIDPKGSSQYLVEWNNSYCYWSSGNWTVQTFSSIPEMKMVKDIFNFSFVSNENESYFTYSLYNSSILSRLVMNVSGQPEQLAWIANQGSWSWYLFWNAPENQSDVYAYCGAFGVYNGILPDLCEWLQGFRPYAMDDLSSGGCVRKTSLGSESKNGNGTRDGFLARSDLTFPSNPKAYREATAAAACEQECLANCSCTAYAFNNSGCLLWEEDLLNLQQMVPGGGNSTGNIYIRLAASELQDPESKELSSSGETQTVLIVLGVVIPILVITSCASAYYFLCKRKPRHKIKGSKKMSEDLMTFNFYSDHDSRENKTDDKMKQESSHIDLPLFSCESVAAATDNFSDENKLGEGGYGPVYRGKLLNGQQIAVKRLSKRSGQGLEEFRNEAILIAKLQHRNLVRLLGCCIENVENILIYEYMPNKSLDFFLFDPTRKEKLDWQLCFRIIEGIAQGLLYLHQYSRLRIIHRDLKPSNILLDGEMNPKISDFGMARIFGCNQSQANTNRIVGTYGYMSPEYAIDGLFSIKSDVFSFGVLLLEIVSGKRNTGFYNSSSLNLLGYAWELWNSDRRLDLIDPVLEHHPSSCLLLRYINVGLLCVQEKPNDRPTMASVVTMITNEQIPLAAPKQPAFISSRHMTDTSASDNDAGNPSLNMVTISILEAR